MLMKSSFFVTFLGNFRSVATYFAVRKNSCSDKWTHPNFRTNRSVSSAYAKITLIVKDLELLNPNFSINFHFHNNKVSLAY